MFVPVKSNTGAMLPWEYLGAAADTYQAGQMLTVTGGKLAKLSAASTTTPPYLCMADVTAADGQVIPVTRVEGAFLYETTLSAVTADAKPAQRYRWPRTASPWPRALATSSWWTWRALRREIGRASCRERV